MKSDVDIRAHFTNHSHRYHQVVRNVNKQLYKNIESELNQNLRGVVLDIGSANVFGYDVNKLQQVIAVDLSFDDETQDSEKIKHIVGDARDLRDIDSDSCDSVIMQFLLHHIVEKSKKLTDNSVLACLKEARRVLKPEGRLIIIEMLVLPFIEFVEDILYAVNHRLLGLINRPMVKFYSKKGLLLKLRSAGFEQIRTKKIAMGKWIDPFGALFPGVVKLPVFLYPAKCCSIIGVK